MSGSLEEHWKKELYRNASFFFSADHLVEQEIQRDSHFGSLSELMYTEIKIETELILLCGFQFVYVVVVVFVFFFA